MKNDWPVRFEETDGLCPGGCGKLHRRCCDSVLGEPHQSRCWLENPMLDPVKPNRPAWARAIARLAELLGIP